MAAKKKSISQKSRKRKPYRQVMEARTKSIAFLNLAAFVVLILLICVAVAVSVIPQWKELQRLEAELDETKASENEAIATLDQRGRELSALRNDHEFQELRARDLLDLHMPGESIIRIKRN